jgi:8-oxo-dGTP pyrophosphatase MutT (NUDIX family)
MVHDTQHNEWSFISGGKKLNESMVQCASRELYEETKGVLTYEHGVFDVCPYFDTRVLHSTAHHSMFKLNTFYRVYFLNMKLTTDSGLRNIEDRFRVSADTNIKEMNENDDLRFFPYRDIKHLPTVWDFIQELIKTELFKHAARRLTA